MGFSLDDHISLKSADDVRQISEPLFHFLKINYFSFHRTYNDGSRIRLCTNARWTEHYIKNEYYKDGRLERHPSLYKSGFVLWDHWPKEGPGYFILKDAKDYFDRDHGLSIIRHHENYVDIYNFTTSVTNEAINNLYLIHMDSIEKFINYFMLKSINIIREAEKNRFFFLVDEQQFISKDDSGLSRDEDTFLFDDLLKIDRLLIEENYNGKAALSKRETECLIAICHGKTVKTIARSLNLSPRTVESYIENIKYKTDCYTREALIQKFLGRVETRDFIFPKNAT